MKVISVGMRKENIKGKQNNRCQKTTTTEEIFKI